MGLRQSSPSLYGRRSPLPTAPRGESTCTVVVGQSTLTDAPGAYGSESDEASTSDLTAYTCLASGSVRGRTFTRYFRPRAGAIGICGR